MPAPAVSVVVPVRDDAAGLERTLAALAHQTVAAEVVVADDGSRGRSVAAVAERYGARLERGPAAGSYAARNRGVAATTGAVLAFTDADCEPRPDWLERGVDAIEAGADLAAGQVEIALSARPGLAEQIDFARHLHQERNVRDAHFGATANLFVRRAALERLGGFNARLASGGDFELGQRARAAGLRLVYAADAIVLHPPRSSARAVAAKAHRLGRSRAALARHGDASVGPRPPIWTRPGAWFPGTLVRGTPLHGAERLEGAGLPVSRLRHGLAEWLLVQVPMAAGDLRGRLEQRREPRPP